MRLRAPALLKTAAKDGRFLIFAFMDERTNYSKRGQEWPLRDGRIVQRKNYLRIPRRSISVL
jgi:hypothetical protein